MVTGAPSVFYVKLLRDVWRLRSQSLAISLVVAAGVGIAIMFEHVAARYDPATVTSLPLVEPILRHDFGLAWRPDLLSRAGRAWVDLCTAQYPTAT